MLVILGFYVCLLLFLLKYNKYHHQDFEETKEISVIIPFRNEEEGIAELINSLEREWLPAYGEIIFVDDLSTDRSKEFITASKLDNTSVISLSEGTGKKKALKQGISEAKYDRIVQLDADVTLSPGFFKKLIISRSDYTTGLVKYKEESGILNLYQRWENLALMFTTRLAILIKVPLMSNGANSNYRNENVDFNESYASGDDLFNMYSIHNAKGNITFNESTYVETKSASSFEEFMHQRLRWMKKAGGVTKQKYRLLSLLMLFSQLSVFYFFIEPSLEFLFLFLFKTILELQGMLRINKVFKYKGMFPFYFLMLILYPISIIFLLLMSFGVSVSWKGRRL